MRAIILVCLMFLGASACGPAWAAGPAALGQAVLGRADGPHRPVTLGEVLFGARGDTMRRPLTPLVGRFTPDGGENFVLDRSTSPPLMRFEDSTEIWVLQPHPAPRGDVIYRNDVGEPMLRATRLGGLTLFTPQHPDGAAAMFEGEAAAIRPPPVLSPGALLQRLAQSSAHASHALQRLVVFDAPDVTADSASPVADAAAVTAEAIGELARRGEPQHGLLKLNRVLLIPGRKSGVSMNDNVLQIVISPALGVAGRPSSRRITMALTR